MAESVEEHIARRRAIADDELHHHGFFAGMKNRMGLATADTVDRITPEGAESVLPFLGGALRGAIQGAVLGLVFGAVSLAFLAPSLIAAGGIYAAMELGAAAFGLYQGVKAVQDHHNQGYRKLSDSIAETSGAVPRDRSQEMADDQQKTNQFYYMERDIHHPERFAEEVRRRRGGEDHQHHR